MANTAHYIPHPGFEDLTSYKIPHKEFAAFVRIQGFLSDWERQRLAGYPVPPGVRDVSARYQQCLRQLKRAQREEGRNG